MNQSSKKILLLGGTGAMGVYLAPALAALNYEVYITSRKERPSNEPKIHYIKGNAKDIEFLEELLSAKYDAIVDFMVYHTDEFETRYEKLLASTPHYLFLSSYRVYGDNGKNPITETSPRLLDCVDDSQYLATDEYGLTKARQENMLIASGYKNWTVVRPAITYSQTRFQLGTMEAQEFLYRALKKKTIIFPEQMLEKEATMSWAGDVATMISKLLFNEKAMGEIFTVSTAEHHKWKEIVQYYVSILGMKVKIVDLEDYTKIIGRPYQIKYDRMYDRIIDNKKILEATGMRQEDLMPLEEGLRIELANFVKNPQFTGVNANREAKIDEITAIKTNKYITKIKTCLPKIRKVFSKELTLKQKISKILNHWRLRPIKKMLTKITRIPLHIKGKVLYDGAIVTLTGNYNYGSVMQRWALQQFLQRNRMRFKLFDFDFMLNMSKKTGDRTAVKQFVDTHLDIETYNPKTANVYRTYIVGSDQVWRDFFGSWSQFGVFFLNFVRDKNVKRLGYAISFGVDTLAGAKINERNMPQIKALVQKFNDISVRETSGIDLVKELGKDATLVLDPTLLMSAKDYSRIIDQSEYKNEPTKQIFYYILDNNEYKRDVIERFSKLHSLSVSGIYPNNGSPLPSPVLWLKGFRDSEFIITDSFHGMVFSIINHKPFFVFVNKARGAARMTELLTHLGIQNRLLYQEDDLVEFPEEPIDWNEVDKKLSNLRKESTDWLLNNLKNK